MKTAKYLAFASAWLMVGLAALLSGCATSGPISPESQEQARPITIDQIRADPDGTRGATVIWGGRVSALVSGINGSSLYIVCFPVPENGEGKPRVDRPSPGRFIAVSKGFLDPEVIPDGSLITVAGQLDGVRAEALGKIQYPYPVLNIRETHVWPMEPDDSDASPNYNYNYYGPGWGWNWYGGPYWWWWGGLYYPYYYHGGYHGYYNGGYHGNYGGGYHGGGGYHEGGGGGGGGGGSYHGGGGGGGGGGHGH